MQEEEVEMGEAKMSVSCTGVGSLSGSVVEVQAVGVGKAVAVDLAGGLQVVRQLGRKHTGFYMQG